MYHFEHVRSYDFIFYYDDVVDKNNAILQNICVNDRVMRNVLWPSRYFLTNNET